MTIHTFERFDLRTTDPDAARRFYAEAIGLDLDAEPATLAVWPLHEAARARGVPAHWLGNIRVTDLDASVRRFRELGSESLGPTPVKGSDGTSFAILRDPLGAVMALRELAGTVPRSPVAWHQLHTTDVDRAWALYSELFGWSALEVVDMPGLEIKNHSFAWQAGGRVVGGMANTARRAGVHTHWLYFFPVPDLEAAIAKVSANGGNVLGPFALPNGVRLTAAEDPQGAAFGIVQASVGV